MYSFRKTSRIYLSVLALGVVGFVSHTFGKEEKPDTSTEVRNLRMGVCTHFIQKKGMKHWDPETYMPLVANLGVGWIRDEILWGQVEREEGVYQLRDHDRAWIDLVNEYNLNVCLTLAGGNSLYENQFDPEAFGRFAAYVAQELDGKVQALEIQNEPFNWYARYFNEGTSRGGDWYGLSVETGEVQSWVDRYRVLLNTAADAIKEANPEMEVIGLGSFPAINYRQIEGGLSPSVDGITAHPYSYRTVPELVPYASSPEKFELNGGRDVADNEGTFASFIRMIREFSEEHGGPSQIWLTEWGYSDFRVRGGSNGNYWGFTPSAVAAYAQRRFVEGLGLDIEMSAIYSLIDDRYNRDDRLKAETNAENHFGLLRSDGSPKPVYDAVRRVAIATNGFVPSDQIDYEVTATSSRKDTAPIDWWDGTTLTVTDDIASYQFEDENGGIVIALWSMERISDFSARSARVSIGIPFGQGESIRVEDLMTGEEYSPVTEEDGKGNVLIPDLGVPPHPVLIYLDSSEA
ncbi:hypothetical protein [Puniceicoccus vermicola]|uniref:Glycoside hydrolase family 5 domain-containing protein n=1 Tax=Puniceicoccus vermicola TaxID=388746 RepID=A0A7X1B0N9_9BACT|nr:hypothetical protein [Puniceicoccus vermicola]MBC2603387.1 hypothetical protein [Puniceicoccus vermicola]